MQAVMIKAQTLKGFRDFLPTKTKKRQFVINILKEVFELYGFEPLETPALEYEEVLTGKYGNEGEKLMYKFEDNGKRKVALRYDQTVPLARVVTQYQSELILPFKRYQIQNVWRAENTQKGRYREFLQCDIDTVGSPSLKADAEIIACVLECCKVLGFKNVNAVINDRSVFKDLKPQYVSTIDKLEKIGVEAVIEELIAKGMEKKQAKQIISSFNAAKPTRANKELIDKLKKFGLKENKDFVFKPSLARGLDYYTSTIVEIVSNDYSYGSLAGGGRYDNLIGIFSGKQIPAVGIAFGFDRLIEAMEELKLFPNDLAVSKILITNSDKAIEIASELRQNYINSEIYLDEKDLEKQLKYADKKQIPYVIITNDKGLILKDMGKRTQETLSLEEIIKKLSACTCGNC
ncbi:MAG: histidine--tRNA ligase [Candidatus Levybacteria bacterium CG_4_10_14_0_8_um_filter_35_23]|nr:MAG: histidine--tRNA ligase [Candidatus Levybacteria bacterium CG_4_10_14_0_8_um_filter_35_23]